MKFSEGDTFKMTDIWKDPNSVFKHAAASRRPVLVTNNSRKEIRKVAVVQSVEEYEAAGKERAFMRAVVKGGRAARGTPRLGTQCSGIRAGCT